MKPPVYRLLGALAIGSALGLSGCESLKNFQRPNQSESESESDKSDDYDRKITRGYHPSGTSSGMWSSQARDIEKDFNVR